MLTDPIADMLTRIRNAQAVGKAQVIIPLAKIKLAILRILKKEGYISDFNKDTKQKKIILKLKYSKKNNTQPAIQAIKKISKSGKRIYQGYRNLQPIKNGLGIIIISTPCGVMTGAEAKRRKLGGEIICEVF